MTAQPARPRHLLDDQTAATLDTLRRASAPTPLAVVAPGGYGKSSFLGELARAYQQAGVPLGTVAQALAGTVEPGAAVLVDDAHLLGDGPLRRLRELAEAGATRLAVAYRPWPRAAGLVELAGVLARSGPTLALGPFSREQVRAYLAAAPLPAPAGPDLVEQGYAQTGGVPRLLAWFTAGMAGPDPVPPAVSAGFRSEWDRMDLAVQQVLLAAEAGVGLHLDLLGALLGRDPDAVGETLAAARATGLLGPAGALPPVVHRVVGALAPAERRTGVRQRLAELHRERGVRVLPLARALLGTGISGASAAATFETAAGEALPDRPALAAQFYAAANAAGRPVDEVAGRWARAAALAGHLDTALRLADRVIAAPGSPERPDAALVAATALAHRGQLGRSAELLRWAGTGPAGVLAAIGLIGTGAPDAAQPLLDGPAADLPPTLLAGAAPLMARGVSESVTGGATPALSTLVRAAALLEPAGPGVLLPDSPAALASLAALHCGELGIAESVLTRATTAQLGGALLATRHRLLLAWIQMNRGQTGLAAQALRTLAGPAAPALEPRDWLFAVALEVGLARRTSDLGALRRIWGRAGEVILRHPVDLFTLLPLGEFAIAAARLRDQERLAPHLAEAHALLARLGDPPLWSTLLHWSCLHAAILTEAAGPAPLAGGPSPTMPAGGAPAGAGHPMLAERHAAALADAAGHSRFAAVVAAAADSWLAVLAGKVDPVAVEEAARGLHAAGMCWEGARLAGQAAIRTTDRKAMVALLDCARLLQGRPAGQPETDPPGAGQPAGRAVAGPAGVRRLSAREREVADLVVAGFTYKQIGDRLFISAKTVEHHVARIRQRLGCTSRGELLARLRELASPIS